MAAFHYGYKAFFFWRATTCSHQPLRKLPVVIAFPSDHLFFSSKHFFFSFEKLTRQLIPNLYCNYVWLQAFIASRHVRLWVVLLFSLKLCPAISVIWWWRPSVGQVVNMESHFLPWILNSSDFVLKYKSKAFMRQLEHHLLWNNNIFSSHRTCFECWCYPSYQPHLMYACFKAQCLVDYKTHYR